MRWLNSKKLHSYQKLFWLHNEHLRSCGILHACPQEIKTTLKVILEKVIEHDLLDSPSRDNFFSPSLIPNEEEARLSLEISEIQPPMEVEDQASHWSKTSLPLIPVPLIVRSFILMKRIYVSLFLSLFIYMKC